MSMENEDLFERYQFHESSTPYKLLLSCPRGLSHSQVSVCLDKSYDRIPHPQVELENSISEVWEKRLAENTSLFNGTKFRYGGYATLKESEFNQETQVSLFLGLTDYRTFMGTNLSSSWEKFLVPSADDIRRCQHTSSPLGNGAVVETSDKKIVVLKRSNNVGEFPGHFVFPGGHPEPEAVRITSHQSGEELTNSETINKLVAQEMFDSIIREVVEEIGAPAQSLSSPLFIGVSRREFNVRPTAFFFMKCNLQSIEIQKLYASAQDGFESTQLFTVSMADLEKMAPNMPGCHEGGFALYKLMAETLKSL